MFRIILFSILILFTISLRDNSFSQDAGLSKVSTGNGFATTDFNIPEGVLTIYLPSDMTVNETASGTVILKGGPNQDSFNQILSKYNLVVESQNVDVIGNNFTIQVPLNLPTGVLSVTLQDKQAKIIKRAFFPVRLTSRSQLPVNTDGKSNFRTPLTSRAGMPAIIEGPFDGNLQTSFISISGQPVILLTESTRQLVFLIPEGIQGQKVLSLKEGATDFKTPFTVLYVVKVGQDDPALASTKYSTEATSSTGDQGVLIESEQQMGKIDLDYNPDLGKTGQEELSPAPARRELTAKGEPSLGPSIDDLSKPLELDPKDFEKYSASSKETDYSENELTSLKQISETDTVNPGVESMPVETSSVAAQPVINSSQPDFDDIKNVKLLLDMQINAPFTPNETNTSTKAEDKVAVQETPQVKETYQAPPEPVKPEIIEEEIKPVTEVSSETKPPEPEIGKADTDKKMQEKELSTQVVKQEPIRDASEYSAKMDVKGVKPKTAPKKEEISQAKVATTTASIDSSKQNKKINELNSLNTSYGAYQDLDKNKQISTDKKSEENKQEQIKEEEFVSLHDKEISKPEVKVPAKKGKFAIQLASLKNEQEASDLVGKLNTAGYDVYYKKFNVPGKGYWYRVRKGGFTTRKEAETYMDSLNLSKYHIKSFFVTAED